MEENVALDSSKQKKFDKSIKGIKKLIKKKDAEFKSEGKGAKGEKAKTGRVSKKRPQRGLVYLSHIPHGFYENEMTQYFKQFGVVTNARVIKSKRTGQSKGYAFVEFKEPAVAEIVAETMNNYLMGKRLIKAAYVPPEKQKQKVFRKKWNAVNNPANNLRIKMKKAHNENKDEKGELQRAKKMLANINKTKKKLGELGINYDFFTPVDVPEVLIKNTSTLIKNVQIKIENEDSKENIVSNDGKSKGKGKKADQLKVQPNKENPKDIKTKEPVNSKVKKEQDKSTKIKNEKNKNVKQIEADKSTQKQKKQSLKDKDVTPLDDFIKVTNDSDNESDSSLDFDSDEYEKMMEEYGDSDFLEDDREEVDAESGESKQEQLPKQKGKNKLAIKIAPVMQKMNKNINKKGTQKKQQPQPLQAKRKALPKAAVADTPKKPKFEKQSSQTRNKQFKKKK